MSARFPTADGKSELGSGTISQERCVMRRLLAFSTPAIAMLLGALFAGSSTAQVGTSPVPPAPEIRPEPIPPAPIPAPPAQPIPPAEPNAKAQPIPPATPPEPEKKPMPPPPHEPERR